MGARAGSRRTAAAIALALTVAACVPEVPLVELADADTPLVTPASPDTLGPLTMRGDQLIDGAGRTVLIHGMNSVNKDWPFISLLESGWLGPLEREYLRNSGFNGVRLGVTFAAIMPEPGVVDERYLDRVVEVVDQLDSDGFWVQLDFHQDVFHQMPRWATPPDAFELSDEAPELLSFIGWAAGYLSPRSMRQWNSFLAGEPHVEGRSVASVLGDAAAALAVRVQDHEHVIGIELLNEPFAGSGVLRCIFEGCGRLEELLTQRHEEMAQPIRAAAPELALWVEPFAPTGYVARPSMRPLSVPPTSDGPQVGMAWHLYCLDTDGGRPELADPLTTNFCDLRMRNGFDAGARLGRQLGGPIMLNEFGASNNPLDAALVTRLADERAVSWMYWHGAAAIGPFDSAIPDVVESQIIRPYAQATAGTPGPTRYDPATGAFSYSYQPDSSIEAPTSIAVPPRAYPSGYDVEVSGATITSAPQSGRLTLRPDPGATTVSVTLQRTNGT